jgi:hypothetical protein
VDPEFIKKNETFLESSMYCWKHLSFSRRLRKNIFIRSENLIKSSAIDDSGKDTMEFGEKRNHYLSPGKPI